MISVIIPVYKVEQYLCRCLESVTGQSYKDLEIILVDDGSPDNCPSMCDAWAMKDTRIKVIHKTNGGLSDARNVGLSASTGEYISFVDSDDIISSGMMENLVAALKRTNSSIAVCRYIRFSEESELENNLDASDDYEVLSAEKALIELINNAKIQQVVWNKLYRRETISSIQFPNGKQHEDTYWTYQAIGNAVKIVLTDYLGYYYRQREGSIMSSGFGIQSLDAIEARTKRVEYLKCHYPSLVGLAVNELQGMCMYQCQKTIVSDSIKKNDKEHIYQYLTQTYSLYNNIHDMSLMPLKQRIWRRMAKMSLIGTSRLRNLLSIGM